MKPILSICIATYNRASYITETLNSIIHQLVDGVEVLVVDGASTDNTEEVIEAFTKKDSRIRYIRLPLKGGVDHDYDKSVEFAYGKYCWLFTDDDLLKPGAISKVMKEIITGYDLIIVNAEVRNKNLSTILEKSRIKILSDQQFSPNEMNALFQIAGDYLSFIGGVIIQRDVWLSRDRKKYFGTEFIHVGIIFQKVFEGSVLVIAHPYIIIRLNNAQWTPRGFDIWMSQWPKLVWSLESIDDTTKQKIIVPEPWRNLKYLISYRASGRFNLVLYQKYFCNERNTILKLFAFVISIFPKTIFDLILSSTRPVRIFIRERLRSSS